MRTRPDPRPLLLLTLLLGCSSRSVPVASSSSALSPRAPEAPPAVVTAAVDEEPPLPGEPNARWPGLAPEADAATSADASDPHPGGHHHHAH